MANSLETLIVLVSLLSIVTSLVDCAECPLQGTVKGKKVPNILKLVEGQNGYYSTVEVNNKDRENLVHEYFNVDRKIGFIDLEAMNQGPMNRRYYYHETEEKIVVRVNTCTRLDLDQTEKVESIKDWFEPADIVAKSEIFEDFIHFGPSVLMIYANYINDKAIFVGSEQIDGRSIDHWSYCLEDGGPYIDFYFDAVTSYPFRFSLFYPQMDLDGNETVLSEDNRHSDYVYNFFIFKPLTISVYEPIPYPIGYGCTRKVSTWTTALPDFTTKQKFSLDMEAIMTYPSGQIIKSTARVMKVGEVYSYEITETEGTVRSIENPPPLGRWEIDEYSGKCRYFTSEYNFDTTLVTRWPFYVDRGFNLLYYIVMKPDFQHASTFIGTIDLGPLRIEEYSASNFFINRVNAVVDYYYPVDNGSIAENNIPSKIVFTKDRNSYDYDVPDVVEVTIIDYRDNYIDYEDRFDVSGCFEDFGSYTWFQIVFSNPWLSPNTNGPLIQQEVRDFLVDFIPITRISDIIVDAFDSNIYATVKLLDRIHFIEAYSVAKNYKIENAAMTLKRWRVEDCEEACTANPACTEFSYCSDFSCDLLSDEYTSYTEYDPNCTHYSLENHNQASRFMHNHFLSPSRFVLHDIRQRINENGLYLSAVASTAEELFVVHGPEEVGDISEEDFDLFGGDFFRGDEYPVIKPGRKFSSGIATEIKVEYTECLSLCSNDDDCNTISYCPNQNKECILSSETSLTLETSLDSTTSAADGCNIYEKSFLNYFTKYPGKSLVVDAVAIKEGVHFTDCAKECVNAKDFNCESFDYCGDHNSLNESVCFLHVHHITTDTSHEVNTSNWKFTDNGCDHFSKKSDHDYRHIVAHELSTESEVIGTLEEIPLQDCAYQCNSNSRGCYTFEYCETVEQLNQEDYMWMPSSWIKATCRMSNVKPSSTSNTNDPEFRKYFTQSRSSDKICSIYINQEKIRQTIPGNYDRLNQSFGSKDRTKLAFGLGAFIFVLAFAVGAVGFTFAMKRELISL